MIVAPTLDALSKEITVRVALAYYQDIYAEKRITLTYEGEIVRLTAQGRREAANLGRIRALLDNRGCRVPLVADIHFLPAAALVAAEQVEKVRINPGNCIERGVEFDELLSTCRRR